MLNFTLLCLSLVHSTIRCRRIDGQANASTNWSMVSVNQPTQHKPTQTKHKRQRGERQGRQTANNTYDVFY